MRKFFKRIIAVGAVALLMVSLAVAETSVWKVTNGTNTVYIGGSIHLLRKSDYPLPKAYNRAFSKSKIIVFETDLSAMETVDFLVKLSDNMHLPKGQTLKNVLNAEAYALIEEYCRELDMPMEYIDTLTPSMVVNTLSVMLIQKIGFAATGVDQYYVAKARRAHKTLDFLESLEFQLDMLLNMGKGYESQYVIYSFKDLGNLEKDMEDLAAAWRTGNIAEFEKSLRSETQESARLYEDTIKKRNDAWIPRLVSYLETPKTEFVIVGAAHLYGPDGIITQLAAAGYTVEQMK